jgi:hypothetical protein
MPFGLTNVPSKFMRKMDDIIWSFANSFVVVYLDDILIFNKTWIEYLPHIQWILCTICQFGEMLIWHEKNSIFRIYHG